MPNSSATGITLGTLGPRGVPLLVQSLADAPLSDAPLPNAPLGDVLLALEQLTALGPDARDALPAVRALAAHDNQLLRVSAIVAEFSIDPARRDDAFSKLVALVPQTSGRRQQQALARIASLGAVVLPYVDQLLQSDRMPDRLVALNVLNAMILDGRFESWADRQPDFAKNFHDLLRRTADNHPDPQTARLAQFVIDNLESYIRRNSRRCILTSIIPVVG